MIHARCGVVASSFAHGEQLSMRRAKRVTQIINIVAPGSKVGNALEEVKSATGEKKWRRHPDSNRG